MLKGKSWVVASVLAFLTFGPFSPAAHAAGANGTQLVNHSKAAVAGILKVAKTSGGRLDPKSKRQAPFWKSLQEMSSTLRTIGQQVAAKDKKLAATLSKGTRTLAKVKTTWPRVGVKDPKVSAYLKKLDNSYTALRSAHGAEGARARKGGALTAAERQRFEQIKRSQVEFGAKLVPLQAQARRNHDRSTDAALTRLIAQSNRIAAAQLAVDAFLAVAILLDDLHGDWDAYSYYVGRGCRDGWGQLDRWVDTTYDTYDTYYVDTFEPYSADAWSHWEVSVEINVDVDFTVLDVSPAEIATLDGFEATSYDDLSWESYDEEFVNAELEQTVFEDEDANLDLAVDSWETEGLEIATADEIAAADSQDLAEEAEEVTDAKDASADEPTEIVDDDATDGADEATEVDEADGSDEADDAAAEVDAAEEGDDTADEAVEVDAADDGADEADDTAAEVDEAADPSADEPEAEEPAEEEEEESPPPVAALFSFAL